MDREGLLHVSEPPRFPEAPGPHWALDAAGGGVETDTTRREGFERIRRVWTGSSRRGSG